MSGVRLLLVDDEENLRSMLQAALRHMGFEVRPAADGREARRRSRSLLEQTRLERERRAWFETCFVSTTHASALRRSLPMPPFFRSCRAAPAAWRGAMPAHSLLHHRMLREDPRLKLGQRTWTAKENT